MINVSLNWAYWSYPITSVNFFDLTYTFMNTNIVFVNKPRLIIAWPDFWIDQATIYQIDLVKIVNAEKML